MGKIQRVFRRVRLVIAGAGGFLHPSARNGFAESIFEPALQDVEVGSSGILGSMYTITGSAGFAA